MSNYDAQVQARRMGPVGLYQGAPRMRRVLGDASDVADDVGGAFYPYLSPDQVNAAIAGLTQRANAAITHVDAQRTLLGQFTGNNDTVLSVEGGIKQIRDLQMPMWQANGLALANVIPQDPSAISAWAATGQTFASAISAIDGYGNDAGLDAVLKNTRDATTYTIVKYVTIAAGVGLAGYLLYGWLGLEALNLFTSGSKAKAVADFGRVRRGRVGARGRYYKRGRYGHRHRRHVAMQRARRASSSLVRGRFLLMLAGAVGLYILLKPKAASAPAATSGLGALVAGR